MVILGLLAPLPAWSGEGEPQIRVLALARNKVVLEIDGRSRTLRVGESSPEGIKLVSADTRAAVVETGGQSKTLVLSRHAGVGGGFSTPEKVEVRVVRDERGAYVTQGRINGRNTQMMVDTGASVIAMSEVQAAALGIDYRNGLPAGVETASGKQDARYVKLDRVEVGGLSQTNVDAVVVSGEYPVMILLGMSFLQGIDMEHQDGMMVLRRRY